MSIKPKDITVLGGIAPLLGLGAAGAARRNYVERQQCVTA